MPGRPPAPPHPSPDTGLGGHGPHTAGSGLAGNELLPERTGLRESLLCPCGHPEAGHRPQGLRGRVSAMQWDEAPLLQGGRLVPGVHSHSPAKAQVGH